MCDQGPNGQSCGICLPEQKHFCYKCNKFNVHRSRNCQKYCNLGPFNGPCSDCNKSGRPHRCRHCNGINLHRSSECHLTKSIKLSIPILTESIKMSVPILSESVDAVPILTESVDAVPILTESVDAVPISNTSNKIIYSKNVSLGLVVLIGNKLYLIMGLRGCENFRGQLTTIGGSRDRGESSVDAIIRECKEEFGICIQSEQLICLKSNTDRSDFMVKFGKYPNKAQFARSVQIIPSPGYERETIRESTEKSKPNFAFLRNGICCGDGFYAMPLVNLKNLRSLIYGYGAIHEILNKCLC